MNFDKVKIAKALGIILLLCVGVTVLTQVIKQNSMTLQEYAEKHPDATAERTKESDEDDITRADETLVQPEDTPITTKQEELSNMDSTEDTTSTSVFVSVLPGAQLNGEAVLELRTTYTDYFYYEPLSEKLREYIMGVSYPELEHNASADETADTLTTNASTEQNIVLNESFSNDLAISYDELRYLHIMHYNFDGELVEGELICNKGIAQDLVEIFYELYRNEYRIEKVLLIENYDGDDTASMEDNNTSCFNYRLVENSTSLSKHALGLAIDINPLYNPYVTYNKDGSENVSPAAGLKYADRSVSFPYKIDENDLCYKLFVERGFIWGGNWNSCKDYQHFQKIPSE